MKKTNFQLYVDRSAEENGLTLDEQLCECLRCKECPHLSHTNYPYSCCYGLYAEMFSTNDDGVA